MGRPTDRASVCPRCAISGVRVTSETDSARPRPAQSHQGGGTPQVIMVWLQHPPGAARHDHFGHLPSGCCPANLDPVDGQRCLHGRLAGVAPIACPEVRA